jgi:hypothetical protein
MSAEKKYLVELICHYINFCKLLKSDRQYPTQKTGLMGIRQKTRRKKPLVKIVKAQALCPVTI